MRVMEQPISLSVQLATRHYRYSTQGGDVTYWDTSHCCLCNIAGDMRTLRPSQFYPCESVCRSCWIFEIELDREETTEGFPVPPAIPWPLDPIFAWETMCDPYSGAHIDRARNDPAKLVAAVLASNSDYEPLFADDWSEYEAGESKWRWPASLDGSFDERFWRIGEEGEDDNDEQEALIMDSSPSSPGVDSPPRIGTSPPIGPPLFPTVRVVVGEPFSFEPVSPTTSSPPPSKRRRVD